MGKSLRRLRNLGLSALVGLGASFFPVKADAQERVSVSGFVGSYLTNPESNWNILNVDTLEANDFDTGYGNMTFHFNDKVYNTAIEDLDVKVNINRSSWQSDADKAGIIVAGDPTGNTNWIFVINASTQGQQFWIERLSPGFNEYFRHGSSHDGNTGIIPEGTNLLRVVYNSGSDYTDNTDPEHPLSITTGWNFFINALKVYNDNTGHIPPLEGKIGVELQDIGWVPDGGYVPTATPRKTTFTNFSVTYTDGVFGGSGISSFTRGDSNNDGNLDISDPVNTLNDLFMGGGGANKCLDAYDINDDGRVDISDAIFSLNYQFLNNNGIKVPPPFYSSDPTKRFAKGLDTTSDNIQCYE